jgi:hypothetical protein
MSQQTNRINIDPSTIDFDNVYQHIADIETLLNFMVGVPSEEKRKLIKVGVTRQKFYEQAYVLAKQNAEIIPPYLNLQDFENDNNLAKALIKLKLKLDKLNSKVDSTLLMVKHENFLSAITIYQAAKTAAQSGSPGADSIVHELADYFNDQKAGGKKTQSL